MQDYTKQLQAIEQKLKTMHESYNYDIETNAPPDDVKRYNNLVYRWWQVRNKSKKGAN